MADYIFVDKPAGVVVHPRKQMLAQDRGNSLSERLERELGRPAFVVHRLDRATSGIMVFALGHDEASRLAQVFREHRAQKTYVALVRGWAPESGTIDKPLAKSPTHEPRPAVSHYRLLRKFEVPFAVSPRHPTTRYSLVEVKTEQGRMHQVRRHLQSIAHPIVGDTLYGEGRHNRYFRERFGERGHRLFLHALRIELPEPWGTQAAPLSADWETILKELQPGGEDTDP